MGDKQDHSPKKDPTAPEGMVLTPEQVSARGKRNIAIALSLLAFVVLVFAATYVRLSGNIESRIKDGSVPPSGVEEGPTS